jgi:tellurite resistance protein
VTRPRTPVRLTPNLFGVPLGLCGLAECWSLAQGVAVVPAWPTDTLWVLAAGVWLLTLGVYLADVVPSGGLRADLADPTVSPFTALIVIVPMLLGVAVADHARALGEAVFFVALALTVLTGAWLAATWIAADMTLAQWHPGYFLPTVAGGLIAAQGSAALGHDALARLMFGYGMTCWLVLGSIILLRLFTQPALPVALIPTVAIEVAPPVVAGAAWFQINGSRPDALALGLAGYAVLMVLVQIRLIPIYRRVPFGPGWWAFSFSYAAVVAVAIRWLAVEQVPLQRGLTYALLTGVTAGMAALLLTTARHLWRGTFFPRRSTAAAAPPEARSTPRAEARQTYARRRPPSATAGEFAPSTRAPWNSVGGIPLPASRNPAPPPVAGDDGHWRG